MKIELKKHKVYPRLSEETTAYVAELHADGRLVATVENTGKGGQTLVRWTGPGPRAEVDAACYALLTEEQREHAKWLGGSVACWCDHQIYRLDDEKRIAAAETRAIRAAGKRGNAVARFVLANSTTWVEFPPGSEEQVRAKYAKKAGFAGWTVIWAGIPVVAVSR